MQIQFIEVEGIDLPESKRFALSDGMLLLDRQNNDLLTNGELGSVSYQLYYDETQELPVYADDLELPVEELNLIRLIEQELTSDGEALSPDIQIFLTTLSQELEGTKKAKLLKPKDRNKRRMKSSEAIDDFMKDQKKESTQLSESKKTDFFADEEKTTETIEPLGLVQEPISKEKPEKTIKQLMKTPKKTPKKTRPSIRKNRMLFLIMGAFFIVVILGAGFFKYLSATTAQEKPPYSELMKKEYYLEAGKEYPEKQSAIEQVLYDKTVDSKSTTAKEALIQFQKVYPTPFGAFDLAILETDYNEALKEYERDKDAFKESQDRMVLIGYCYLKTDQLSEAKDIVKETKSTELERYVYKYEQKQDEINNLEKDLAVLKKNPVDNKDKIEKAMNELFDAKEALLNL